MNSGQQAWTREMSCRYRPDMKEGPEGKESFIFILDKS